MLPPGTVPFVKLLLPKPTLATTLYADLASMNFLPTKEFAVTFPTVGAILSVLRLYFEGIML